MYPRGTYWFTASLSSGGAPPAAMVARGYSRWCEAEIVCVVISNRDIFSFPSVGVATSRVRSPIIVQARGYQMPNGHPTGGIAELGPRIGRGTPA